MKQNKGLYFVGLTFVSILLFILHTAFAYDLLPLFSRHDFFKQLFVLWNGTNLKILIPYIFGLCFSIAVAIIMYYLRKSEKDFKKFIKQISWMELIQFILICFPFRGWYLTILASVYYGIYIKMLIELYATIKPAEEEIILIKKEDEKHHEKMRETNEKEKFERQLDDLETKVEKLMVEEKLKNHEIIKLLDVDKSKVSRIRQRVNLRNLG